MDLTTPKYLQAPPQFWSNVEEALETNTGFYGKSKENPFADSFQDPLCKLNLKETSEFVKAFPVSTNVGTECRGCLEVSAQRRREGVNSVIHRTSVKAPPTPGRPVFSFSVGHLAKKSFPSKWDDAEKWLSSSCQASPAHTVKPLQEASKFHTQCDSFEHQMEEFAEKSRVTEERVSRVVSCFDGSVALEQHNLAKAFHGVSLSADMVLKDKFTTEIEPFISNSRYSEPSKEGFLFRNSTSETMKDAGNEVIHDVKHRDIGTEMTPLASSTTSRCHTPFKSSSPARHNTPANRSGPLASSNSNNTNNTIDISQLRECHLAKLQLGTQYDSVTSNWSSREEEEEEISKSLRHFETGMACRKSISDSRAAGWEEDEMTKFCLRYQREEAKIQAWVDLQNAKAEAQSKKLEVKIQKMQSNLEEKLMKRMAVVRRKAEEWRAAARLQHSQQIQRGSEQAPKMKTTTMMNRRNLQISSHTSCGCYPFGNHH